MEEIVQALLEKQDKSYAVFQAKLIPNIPPEQIIGVRTPELRSMAKKMRKEKIYERFLLELPHTYYEERQLHAFIISEEKDFDICIAEVEKFLPYVDNWSTCDQGTPKVFGKNKERLLPYIRKWIKSGKTYTIRFGIRMLMCFYLEAEFDESYLRLVAEVVSDEYYVNMMIAWYYATALAKQWEATVALLEEQCLSPWVQNKAIQKARESYRISPEQKAYLLGLKR